MGRLTTVLASLCAISLLPSTQAWTLAWERPNGDPAIEAADPNSLARSCTEINNPKDAYFEFDSEGDPVTLYLYTTDDCSGPALGYATTFLAKNASRTIRSYEVLDRSVTTTIVTTITDAPTSTSTSPSPTPMSSQTTASSTPVPHPSSGGSSISAGAIGGIVVGVVIGLGLIGAIIYLARQRQKQTPPISGPITAPTDGAAPGDGPSYTSPSTDYPPVSQTPLSPQGCEPYTPQFFVLGVEKVEEPPVYVAKQQHASELPGDMGMVELSDTQRLNEIGESTKRFDV